MLYVCIEYRLCIIIKSKSKYQRNNRKLLNQNTIKIFKTKNLTKIVKLTQMNLVWMFHKLRVNIKLCTKNHYTVCIYNIV